MLLAAWKDNGTAHNKQ